MIYKFLSIFIFLLFIFNTCVFAQNEDLQSTVDYKVDKMKKELKLTDAQADAIGPIIKDYLTKREAILQEAADQGIVDKTPVKAALKALKENEYQKLGKILTNDQMNEWVNRENLMATLNPDGMESSVDEGTTLTANGANFKF